ncbi:conserved hypothetical protein [Vibrio parahaemolyticus AN-5034]|nr:conserved hypothetical protein [Vibrio parahaemolyticus AN-5034]
MVETNDYQMAIDLLRCHLGISEDEPNSNSVFHRSSLV